MFKIKYVGWCHVCKYYGPEGGFICGCCNVKGTCDRPSEYVEGDTETVPTGSITIQSGKGSVTIPQGVNVVLVEQYWNLNGSPTETSLVGVTSGKTYNLESTYTEFNEGQGEIYEVDNISNRKFWLYAEYGTIDVETDYRRLAMKISWSPIINERPFHWTDY